MINRVPRVEMTDFHKKQDMLTLLSVGGCDDHTPRHVCVCHFNRNEAKLLKNFASLYNFSLQIFYAKRLKIVFLEYLVHKIRAK